LFDALRDIGLATDADAKFFVACMLLALDHLFERKIVHRDLKPENTMVDEEGYPKLIDFGTAKFVNGRTYTIIGTPHYMAPEVLTGRGYSLGVDMWSLGVMLYEFLCGGVPFGEELTDPYKVYEKVLKEKLKFPAFMGQSFPAKTPIEWMLKRNPAERGTPSQLIEKSEWLRGFNWESIMSRSFKPKYTPKIKPIDTSRIQAAPIEATFIKDEEGILCARPKKAPPADWDRDF
jgi:cGMP-dependent protein kinase